MTPLQEGRALAWARRKPLGHGMTPPDVLRLLERGLVQPQHMIDGGRVQGWWWSLTPAGVARLRELRGKVPALRYRLPARRRYRALPLRITITVRT
jgi:hypothetical protein